MILICAVCSTTDLRFNNRSLKMDADNHDDINLEGSCQNCGNKFRLLYTLDHADPLPILKKIIKNKNVTKGEEGEMVKPLFPPLEFGLVLYVSVYIIRCPLAHDLKLRLY
jgi:hypothetical protein